VFYCAFIVTAIANVIINAIDTIVKNNSCYRLYLLACGFIFITKYIGFIKKNLSKSRCRGAVGLV
jgi:hypothetical protein